MSSPEEHVKQLLIDAYNNNVPSVKTGLNTLPYEELVKLYSTCLLLSRLIRDTKNFQK